MCIQIIRWVWSFQMMVWHENNCSGSAMHGGIKMKIKKRDTHTAWLKLSVLGFGNKVVNSHSGK